MEEYTAAHVANYFLISSKRLKNIVMNPLKLMKMVYFSYAWYLHLTNSTLFDEQIEAWKHGPVIPSLYHEFKHLGLYGNIKESCATNLDLNSDDPEPTIPLFDIDTLENNDHINEAVCGVWMRYKECSAEELEKISHNKNSAWLKLYKENKNVILDNETIKQEGMHNYNESKEILNKHRKGKLVN